MQTYRRRSTTIAVWLAAITACSNAPETGSPAVPPASLAEVQALGVRNAAQPVPNVVAAAQVTEEQLDSLSLMGYTRFISLRPPDEQGAGWEEAHAMPPGVVFSRIPVAGSAGLTRANVEALARLLDEAADQGTVVYCASSNRVGALMALKAYWLDGADPADALALGRSAGLRGLEPAVTELLEAPR